MLTPPELRDDLILLAAALIVLPILPDGAEGPGGAISLRALFLVVVLVMAISAAGHVATRVVGARVCLTISSLPSDLLGPAAVVATMALAGLASTNSATVALASLVSSEEPAAGALPHAAALTASALVRVVLAWRMREQHFRHPVALGLVLQVAALWAAWWFGDALRALLPATP